MELEDGEVSGNEAGVIVEEWGPDAGSRGWGLRGVVGSMEVKGGKDPEKRADRVLGLMQNLLYIVANNKLCDRTRKIGFSFVRRVLRFAKRELGVSRLDLPYLRNVN